MSRVTVFGGRGYVGRHLAAHLRLEGHEVLVPDRGAEARLEGHLGHVVYAIGLTADFRSRPFDTVEAHVSYLARVLHEASFSSLLYLSSTRVYARCDIADEAMPIMAQPNDPADLYNLSKLMGESLALHCGREGVRVARLANVVGGSEPSESFLASLVREARAGEIRLQTAPDTRKDYIHIDDAVQMLSALAVSGAQSIYNVASGVQTSSGQWADALCHRFGCKVSVTPSAPNVSFPVINIRRFVEEFSFRPSPAIRAVSELA